MVSAFGLMLLYMPFYLIQLRSEAYFHSQCFWENILQKITRNWDGPSNTDWKAYYDEVLELGDEKLYIEAREITRK